MFRKSIEGLSSARCGKQYRNAIVRSVTSRCSRFAIALRLVAALSLAWPPAAFGGLYKCARDDRTVMYQEDPCPPGKELRDFERDPATVSVVPFDLPPPAAGTPAAPGARKNAAKAGAASRASPEGQSGASGRASRTTAERTGNPAERKFLVPGIGEGEVVARIGRPDMSSGAGRKTVRWTYLPAPQDPQTITTLTFELGRLIQVERKIVRTP
jgi:hypothetical protein